MRHFISLLVMVEDLSRCVSPYNLFQFIFLALQHSVSNCGKMTKPGVARFSPTKAACVHLLIENHETVAFDVCFGKKKNGKNNSGHILLH